MTIIPIILELYPREIYISKDKYTTFTLSNNDEFNDILFNRKTIYFHYGKNKLSNLHKRQKGTDEENCLY